MKLIGFKLYLEYCGLRDIYPSLQYANFTALDVFDLSNNDFVPAKLPNWIFNFSSGAISNWVGQNIITLQLRSNLFSGNIPTTICKLDFLKILDLSNNKLSGPIPSCCGVSLFASRNVKSVFVESVYPPMFNPKVLSCVEMFWNSIWKALRMVSVEAVWAPPV
ncbi:hypothetical protein HN51_054066 [Arachis hypogaea]